MSLRFEGDTTGSATPEEERITLARVVVTRYVDADGRPQTACSWSGTVGAYVGEDELEAYEVAGMLEVAKHQVLHEMLG